jgi:hypothetical protein
MFRFMALCLAALCAACTTPQYNYSPKTIAISEPPTGVVTQKSVGDTLLQQGKYREHAAIYLERPAEARWAYTLTPGYYLKTGEADDGEFFLPGGGDEAGSVVKAALADPWRSIMIKKDSPNLCIVTAFNIAVCGSDANYERRDKPVLAKDAFQQTLIYSGRVGNKINIGYREFSGNMARPAFNNDVEYDLSESNLIGYKGAQLEVVEATNQHLRYRVIKNFNAPEGFKPQASPQK